LSFLFIGTTGDHAGHRFFTWAIARRLVEKGLSVGFLKTLWNPSSQVGSVLDGPGCRPVYSILSDSSLLRDSIKGIILDRMPQVKLQEIKDRTIPW